MMIARVIGTLVSTQKEPTLEGLRFLVCKPVNADGEPAGSTVVAVDAGVGERVLVLDEGNGARQILGGSQAPVRSMVVGVVDAVDLG